MKFVVAVVMLALAVGVQSSLLAAHAPAVSYVTQTLHPTGAWGAWGGPWAHGPAAIAIDNGLGLGHGGWDGAGAWGGHGWGIPGISLAQGPGKAAVLAAPLALGHGHEGVYVAKTRGAIHTAPLAGHINSATSLNVAPAPGTH